MKEVAVSVFKAAGFDLHKWHSNAPELEANAHLKDEGQTYAKEQLGIKPNEAKLLGLPWHKEEDTLTVVLSRDSEEATKREVLRSLASVYDPLGVAGPVTVKGKMIFREACDQHLPWDAALPEKLRKQWEKFKQNQPRVVIIPRCLTSAQEPVQAIDLHAFCDASGSGTAAAVYAVVHQESGAPMPGSTNSKGSIIKERSYNPKIGACIRTYGGQSCEQCNKCFGRTCCEVCVWVDRKYGGSTLDCWSRELQTIRVK